MIRVERSVVINRPDWAIFTFLASPENDVAWREQVRSVRRNDDGALGPGASYWCVMRVFPLGKLSGIMKVVEYEPDRRLSFQGNFDGTFQPTASYALEPVEGGTSVTAVMESRLEGLGRLFGSLVGWATRRSATADLARLKELLERRD